jgi:protein O-mannosyl-transferase
LPPKKKLRTSPSAEPDGLFTSPKKRNIILCLALVAATLALYNPVNTHPFVNYDDDRYVVDNAHIHAGLGWDTVRWAFSTSAEANWHPLTWLSHALDYQLFHANPAGHHFTSLLIHTLNAALLFWLLARATGQVWPSLWVAAMFALHPMNVESVAWVAERKNVLSTFFFLAALGAYGWYALKPNWQRYLAVAACFALGLMSKPMVITLPCVLVLLDYWPLGRVQGGASAMRAPQMPWSKLLVEKIPLLALSAASAVITLVVQQAGGAMRSTRQFSLVVRLENALVAYATYLWKTIWPAYLAPLYPHPGDSLAGWQVTLSVLILAAITALALKLRARRYLMVGWLWFLGTLVPVIGLIQVGDQAMADRYAYIPLIGIFVMVAWGAFEFVDAQKMRARALAAAAVLSVIGSGAATNIQLGYWSSNYELWSHTLAVTQKNFIAEDNLGGALVLEGKADEAYPHFQAAAEINPHDPMSHFNVGAYLQQHNQLRDAVEQYETTLRLTTDRPLLASTYANLGTAYRALGDYAKAEESYQHALQLNPEQFNAYLGRGVLLEMQGRLDEAIASYKRSIELVPSDQGYTRMAHALQAAGRTQEAIAAYQEALKINSDSHEAQAAVDTLSKNH